MSKYFNEYSKTVFPRWKTNLMMHGWMKNVMHGCIIITRCKKLMKCLIKDILMQKNVNANECHDTYDNTKTLDEWNYQDDNAMHKQI